MKKGGDAIKGLKHFPDEELVHTVEVGAGKDTYKRLEVDGRPALSVSVFNLSSDDYVVRIYKKVPSVKLPKRKA